MLKTRITKCIFCLPLPEWAIGSSYVTLKKPYNNVNHITTNRHGDAVPTRGYCAFFPLSQHYWANFCHENCVYTEGPIVKQLQFYDAGLN